MTTRAESWKGEALVRAYLEGIRGAIPLAQEQIDVMLRLIAAATPAVERVLDLGSGSGVLARALLDVHAGATATLVDFSEPMLAEARVQMQPYMGRHTIVKGDLAEPAWLGKVDRSGPYDAIVSGYAIHHLADARKQQLYAEAFGLLRPGGCFVNIDHVSSPTTWIAQQFDELLIDSFYAYQQAIGSDKTRDAVATEYVHRDDRQENILAPVEDQCRWLQDCGFQDVDCYFKLFELAVFGGRKAAR